jgi:F-type H+-transporting ATPase subunit a
MTPFPQTLWEIGPFALTDTVATALGLSVALIVGLRVAMGFPSSRAVLEVVYDALEAAITEMASVDVRPLVPLILTQWVFIGFANLVGLVPGLSSPTRDLGLTASLALISFVGGHVYAIRESGWTYLRQYLEPSPFLLPFNVLGELTRTIALALRLFGNMLSGTLVGAILVYIAGFLVPVPLLLLSALTAVVQAYIFGVLTLVFAVSSLEVAGRRRKAGGAALARKDDERSATP